MQRSNAWPDLPACLQDGNAEDISVYPRNRPSITEEARLDPGLDLFGILHVQANPDLCASIQGPPSPERPLSLHKHFPKSMRTVHTIGEFQAAIHAAFTMIRLMDPQLRPIAPPPARSIPPSWTKYGKKEWQLLDPSGAPLGRGEVQRPDFVPGPVSPPAEETPRSFATSASDNHWDDVAAELGLKPQGQ